QLAAVQPVHARDEPPRTCRTLAILHHLDRVALPVDRDQPAQRRGLVEMEEADAVVRLDLGRIELEQLRIGEKRGLRVQMRSPLRRCEGAPGALASGALETDWEAAMGRTTATELATMEARVAALEKQLGS